ncbi:MAG: peptidase [Firmicutes bacterium]|nr:peptidase [Bacillota bacterium]
MKKRLSEGSKETVRTVYGHQIWLATHRAFVVPSVLSVLLVAAILIGYFAGHADPTRAYALSEAAGLAQMKIARATEEDRIQIVEQINLEEQLSQEKVRNDSLAVELDQQQNEMSNIQDTILNALMANLTDKMVSRSGASESSYTTEAKNLISLNKKLLAFKKTDMAKEVDLTEYENLLTKRLAHLPTLKPVPGTLSGYGYRRHPVFHYYHFHPAADMPNKTGTPIKAAGAGKISESGYSRTEGNYLTINHGNGFTTTYMHCSKLYVSTGDVVEKGDKIAAVGNTGTSTGAHLHFEVKLYGSPVNPKSIVLE